jgi:cholesterol transport system auxiliary component
MTKLPRRAVLIAPAVLAACSVLPARPYQEHREWPLEATRPTTLPAPANAPVLLLRDTEAAPGLDKRGLRTLLPDGSVGFDNWEEWAVPPSQAVGASLAQWLADSGLFRAVVSPGTDLTAGLVLESELLALAADPSAGTARLTLSLVLLRRTRTEPVPLLQRTVTGQVPLGAATAPAIATALCAALAETLRQTELALAPFAHSERIK